MRPHTFARFFALALALCAFPFVGCDSNDEDDDAMALIDPSDPNAISNAISFSSSAQQIQGNAPQPTTDADSPTLTGTTSTQVTPGQATSISLNVDGSANVAGFYFQVDDAGSYFDVDYVGTPLTSGATTFSFTLPEGIAEGGFNGLICVYDDNGLISNPVGVTFNISFSAGQGDGDVRVSGAFEDSYDGTSFAFVTTSGGVTTIIGYVFDADFADFDADDGRFAYFFLSGNPDERTYQVPSFSETTIASAGYFDYEDDQEIGAAMEAQSGSVTLSTLTDERLAGTFDYSGTARNESGGQIGEIRVRGSFDADIQAGNSPFDPGGGLLLPEGVPTPEELMRRHDSSN